MEVLIYPRHNAVHPMTLKITSSPTAQSNGPSLKNGIQGNWLDFNLNFNPDFVLDFQGSSLFNGALKQ